MPEVGRKPPFEDGDIPTDHLAVSVRAYVTLAPDKKAEKKSKTKSRGAFDFEFGRQLPSDWVLVFDCETRTTPDQSLKFGTYQLRRNGVPQERGAFYDPDMLTPHELAVLQTYLDNEEPSVAGENIRLRTRDDFVRTIFYGRAYQVGGQIVGFNLPFDISRLALRHIESRGDMRGGFTFYLVDDEQLPAISVRHLSQRTSWIRFRGLRPKTSRIIDDDDEFSFEKPPSWDRGYFVDVKTLAAALLSESHTLESLSSLLHIDNEKESVPDHGKTITPDYVRYAMNDAQATWECYEVLNKQFENLNLGDTGAYELYSEASLGKAYLKAMNIKPWREVQRNYPPERIGQILSAYFGGRSEVHIRREIVDVIHCDVLSTYPSVCTLMGLWSFVTATGMTERIDTEGVGQFVERYDPETLHSKDGWRDLAAIVQVLPQRDLFPVRAEYVTGEQPTIGLNYLTSDEPMWFTLADVLVSKILTGKSPHIVQAIRFNPKRKQSNLSPVTVAGRQIHPDRDDFYKSLIEHRLTIGDKIDTATDDEKPRLESDRKAIKILANATSYGIFVELNVKDYDRTRDLIAYGLRGNAWETKAKKVEEPGKYFHPLLATLITGAARLMLALAERQVIDQGLDWAFCDTDSIAIANPGKLPFEEFKRRAIAAQQWFTDLNPYGRSESILQLEKVNVPKGARATPDNLTPLSCLTVSAKRYVLFNRDGQGAPIVRKASGHGLGHLLPPYDEPIELHRKRLRDIGVPLWQEDYWKEIIRAIDESHPGKIDYTRLVNFTYAAISRYSATKPALLQWFDGYNGIGLREKSYGEQVKPFNFLLSLQAKSRSQMAHDDMAALRNPLWYRREPRPAAPYLQDVKEAAKSAFDREKHEFTPIPEHWLKSYERSLIRYHLHREAKFWGGNFDETGSLRRRHVHALAFRQIGKEADNIEEREFIGDGDEDVVSYDFGRQDRSALREHILAAQKARGLSDRDLCRMAKVSHHTMAALRTGKRVTDAALLRLAARVDEFGKTKPDEDDDYWMEELRAKRDELGSDAALAEFLGISRPYATRLLSGERRLTRRIISRLRADLHGA